MHKAYELASRYRAIPLAVLVVILLAYPLAVDNRFLIHIAILALLYSVFGHAWNLLAGFAGQISFGHAMFLGVGAYASTILFLNYGISPWIGMFASGAVAALLALPLGWITFRLRGPYFALATLASAEVIRVIALNWFGLTGGGDGLNILGLIVGNYTYYYVTLAVAAFAVAVVWAIQRSRWGYFYAAIRDDEDAAASLGIAARRMKMVALTTGAFLVGLAGSIYASYHLYINPGLVFAVHRSVEMIVVSIVGGIGTVAGPLVGAAVLIPISEYLRGVTPEAHLLLYGVFIVMFLLFLPEGVVGWLRKHMALQRARPGTKVRAIEDEEHAAAER